MRTRLLPRVLVGLVVAGSLTACGLPGGGEPSALLTISPNPGFFDLQPNSLSSDTVVFTVKNVGFAGTGALSVDFDADAPGLDGFNVLPDCPNGLAPGDTCTAAVTLQGAELPLG